MNSTARMTEGYVNCSFLIPQNFTSNIHSKPSEQEETLKTMQYYIYVIIIPMVCAFGFIGNILNVVIFTKKKNQKSLDEMEHCTTICLVALAISDMMFCLTTFPNAFLPERKYFNQSEFMLYYKAYSMAIINIFILSSTLLTVLTAIMRYLVICHPFHSRQFISLRTTIIAIIVASVITLAFNVPTMWRFKMVTCQGMNNEIHVEVDKGDLFKDKTFVYAYKILWAILGNFVPLAILLYCNIQLIKALRESKQLRLMHSRDDTSCISAHRRINITLITIIILFFVFVAPSEITKFIFYITQSPNGFIYQFVSLITNALQCINFSVNFILYYVIIAPFRKTFHEFVCILSRPRRSTRDSSNSGKQQTIMLLSVRDRQNLL